MIKIVVAVMATLTVTHHAVVAVTVRAIVIVIAHVVVTTDLLRDAVKRKGG